MKGIVKTGFYSLIGLIIFMISDFIMRNSFDYCVINVCCTTHNYGIQDFLWTLHYIVFIVLILYGLLTGYFSYDVTKG